MTDTEWYASWFDTSYYHLLYNHRNEEEAREFMERLVHFLALPPGSKVLDLACGKGRHARTLQALGLDVVGTDLSPQSIEFAQQYSNEHLAFQVQDMRIPLENAAFDAVFNLFTSFGYFDHLEDNLQVIKAIGSMVVPEGMLVIDFLNAERVKATLVPEEQVHRGTIVFNIKREVLNGKVIKHIAFSDQGKAFQYTEQVQLLGMSDFQTLLEDHFRIQDVFGDYRLSPFDPDTSPRLILIAKKR